MANQGCQKCHSTCLGILGIIDLPCCDEGEVVCKEHQQSQGHHVQLHGPDGDHKHLENTDKCGRKACKKGCQSLSLCTFILESLLTPPTLLLLFWQRNLLPLSCVSSLGCCSLASPPLYLGKEKPRTWGELKASPLLPGIPPAWKPFVLSVGLQQRHLER